MTESRASLDCRVRLCKNQKQQQTQTHAPAPITKSWCAGQVPYMDEEDTERAQEHHGEERTLPPHPVTRCAWSPVRTLAVAPALRVVTWCFPVMASP